MLTSREMNQLCVLEDMYYNGNMSTDIRKFFKNTINNLKAKRDELCEDNRRTEIEAFSE